MKTQGQIDPNPEPAWPTIHRISAFTDTPEGGNPAGVVVTEQALAMSTMHEIAAAVGYSETAFLSPDGDDGRYRVRYFSPEAEVSFCGHATIASAVLLGQTLGPARYEFQTNAGAVTVEVHHAGTQLRATLTSVPPSVVTAEEGLVADALAALDWRPSDLDRAFTPAIAYAGANHLILVVNARRTLAELDYDFDRLGAIMADHDLTTVALLWQEQADRFHARNPFPPGGVVEDPATGAAAAAFGAYLRAYGHLSPPADIQILQGQDMGRPSQLFVHIPAGSSGIEVSGTAVAIEAI